MVRVLDGRFTGQTLDTSTGLYWYASQAYDAGLARFVQPDEAPHLT
jgi:RHS repeat-associated protein